MSVARRGAAWALAITVVWLGQPARAQPSAASEADPPKAGWIEDQGFVLTSEGEAYKLRIGLQSGFKGELVYRDGDAQDRHNFAFIRPILAGNVFEKWIQYWVSLELASNPPFLLDCYVDVRPVDAIGLRVGQQYTPFSRHEEFGPQQLLFPEFSVVANYFWSGRDKGATVNGEVLRKTLAYYLGFYGGSPLRQFTTIAGNYVVLGRVTWSPLGPPGTTEYPYIVDRGEAPAPFRVSFTLDGYYGKIRLAEENFNRNTFSFSVERADTTNRTGVIGADVWLQSSRLVAFVEGYFRESNPQGDGGSYASFGAWGQVGVLLVDHVLDVAVRLSWVDPSNDLDDDRFIAGELQFAYYIDAPHLVLKLRYGVGDQTAPNDDELGAVALVAPAGTTHVATLQLTLAF